MPLERHIGFIRAIMIGREGLSRDVVLQCFADAGAVAPVNHLTTGNVSFDAEPDRAQAIATEAGNAMAAIKGKDTPVFVRTLDELRAFDEAVLFADVPFDDIHTREVSFASEPVDVDLPIWGRRQLCVTFAARGRELFTVTRMVDGETTGPGRVVERALGAPVTTRAFTSINKIIAAQD